MPRKNVKTKKKAPKGSRRDAPELTEMAELLALAHSSPDVLNENLPRFIELLDPSGIPPDGIPIALSQVQALPALLGIARWANLNPDIVGARLTGSWPIIWSWTRCLLNVESEELKALAHQACYSLVVYLGVDQGMCELMASTPGTIATTVKLWVAELRSRYSAIPHTVSASRAVHMFIDSGKSKRLNEIMATLGDEDKDVANTALDTIRRRIRGSSKIDIPSLYADLAILHAIWDIQDLRADLFGSVGIQIIKNTMVRLLCSQSPDYERAALCLTYCVKYYMHGLLSNHGRSWAYRMFDAPIIRAIIQASIWSTGDDYDLGEALDALTPYLLFRTVLRRAESALDDIHELDLENSMNKDGRVYDAFKRYQSLASERLVIAEGRSLGTRVCGNQSCSKVGRGKEFMRCSSCLKVHYCSKVCQKQSWKTGDHRHLCKLVTVMPDVTDEGPECRILVEDHKFLCRVIQSNMRIHRLHIAELKYKLLLSNPAIKDKFHLVAIVFDHTKHTLCVRLETDVVGTSLATWGDVDGHKALLTMVDRLESAAGGLIVHAVLPYGKESFPCEFLMRGVDKPGFSPTG